MRQKSIVGRRESEGKAQFFDEYPESVASPAYPSFDDLVPIPQR